MQVWPPRPVDISYQRECSCVRLDSLSRPLFSAWLPQWQHGGSPWLRLPVLQKVLRAPAQSHSSPQEVWGQLLPVLWAVRQAVPPPRQLPAAPQAHAQHGGQQKRHFGSERNLHGHLHSLRRTSRSLMLKRCRPFCDQSTKPFHHRDGYQRHFRLVRDVEDSRKKASGPSRPSPKKNPEVRVPRWLSHVLGPRSTACWRSLPAMPPPTWRLGQQVIEGT